MSDTEYSFLNTRIGGTGITSIFLFIVVSFIAYYTIGTGYIYKYMRNPQGDITDSPIDMGHIGTIFGVAFLCSIALAIGLIMITLSWTVIENKAILGIIIATIALSLSVTAMTFAALTH